MRQAEDTLAHAAALIVQRAGFSDETVVECHGSIHHRPCTRPCCDTIWPADAFLPEVDMDACKLVSNLPVCRHCGALAHPNISMFGDGAWLPGRSEDQYARFTRWRAEAGRLAVIGRGAAVDIPFVRRMAGSQGKPVILQCATAYRLRRARSTLYAHWRTRRELS